MQQKHEFVYRIFKVFPEHKPFGELTFQIETKERTYRDIDQMFISWQCNKEGTGSEDWYNCNREVKLKNYELRPLVQKMEKAQITSSTKPDEIIDFLHDNKIKQALYIQLFKDYSEIFAGVVSISEIIEGKFERDGYKYTILAGQQEKFMDEIMKSKQITPPKKAVA